jgi:hypothetical protein
MASALPDVESSWHTFAISFPILKPQRLISSVALSLNALYGFIEIGLVYAKTRVISEAVGSKPCVVNASVLPAVYALVHEAATRNAVNKLTAQFGGFDPDMLY